MAWSYGTTSQTRGIASAIGDTGIAVGASSSVTRDLGDRAYYRSIDRVQLLSWIRKGKQWYAVSLTAKRGESKVILRTRSLEDAKLFTDAVSSVLTHFNSISNETSDTRFESSDTAGKNEPQN